MEFIYTALAILTSGGIAAFFFSHKTASQIGIWSTILASFCGLIPSLNVLLKRCSSITHLVWNFPFSSLEFGIDSISAFFITILLIIAPLAAVFGKEYLQQYQNKRINFSWGFFCLLIASILLTFLARNGLLFLIAWEMSAIASFFLVTFEDEKKSVRLAGFIYLVAAAIGTTFLIPLFILLDSNGSLNFEFFKMRSSLIFLLAFLGFGIKAGLFPFHVWLPKAHPAAPSHISALMSGVMIKMGLYGIIRTITFMDNPPLWCGLLLVFTGLASGLFGIILATGQRDIKRLLAYSSIENIGIITLSLGLGLLGLQLNNPALITLGVAGSLFHLLNHSIFKSLLFMGSGAIYHATGTRDLNGLGGLLKFMPQTAFYFLIGAMAISAMPILNGFFSEFIIYLAAFKGIISNSFSSLAAVIGMALIGGLTVICFVGTYGMVFLGSPRSQFHAHEAGPNMRFSLFMLAFFCILIPLISSWILPLFIPMIFEIGKIPVETTAIIMQKELAASLFYLIASSTILSAFVILALCIRYFLTKRKPGQTTETWGCAFSEPTATMQYNFSSFTKLVSCNFKALLRPGEHFFFLKKIFPKEHIFSTKTFDVIYHYFYRPFFKRGEILFFRLHRLQHGHLHFYILYICATLLFLLIFKLR